MIRTGSLDSLLMADSSNRRTRFVEYGMDQAGLRRPMCSSSIGHSPAASFFARSTSVASMASRPIMITKSSFRMPSRQNCASSSRSWTNSKPAAFAPSMKSSKVVSGTRRPRSCARDRGGGSLVVRPVSSIPPRIEDRCPEPVPRPTSCAARHRSRRNRSLARGVTPAARRSPPSPEDVLST